MTDLPLHPSSSAEDEPLGVVAADSWGFCPQAYGQQAWVQRALTWSFPPPPPYHGPVHCLQQQPSCAPAPSIGQLCPVHGLTVPVAQET